jgi:curved DNA-binding protein CbpA
MSSGGRYRSGDDAGRPVRKGAVEVGKSVVEHVRLRERVSAIPGESRGTGPMDAPRKPGLTSAVEHQTGMRRIDPRSDDFVDVMPSAKAVEEAPQTGRHAELPAEPEQSKRPEPRPGPDHARPVDAALKAKLEGLDVLFASLSEASHYTMLGLASSATPKDIRAAYFALAKRYHPDVFFRRDIGDARRKLEAVFDTITQAYETLRRPLSRSEYDDSLGLLAHQRHVPPRRKSSGAFVPVESESDRAARELREHPLGPPSPFDEPARHAQVQKLPPRDDEPRGSTVPGGSARAPRPANQKPLRAQAEARAARQVQPPRATHLASTPMPVAPLAQTAAAAGSVPPARPSVPNPSPRASEWERSTQLRELEQLKQLRDPLSAPPSSGVLKRDSMPAPNTGTRNSLPPQALPSLVAIGLEFHGGTGIHNWIAQRVREAHQEELAGHAVDAANILRIVLAQHKDARIEAHVERLSRMGSHKTVPAHRARARAAETEGRWQDAASSWESIVKLVPDDAQATFSLARTLMVAGDLKAAGRAAMRAAELAPTHLETRELLVEFFDRMGMKLNARREREVVTKLLESRAAAAEAAAKQRSK